MNETTPLPVPAPAPVLSLAPLRDFLCSAPPNAEVPVNTPELRKTACELTRGCLRMCVRHLPAHLVQWSTLLLSGGALLYDLYTALARIDMARWVASEEAAGTPLPPAQDHASSALLWAIRTELHARQSTPTSTAVRECALSALIVHYHSLHGRSPTMTEARAHREAFEAALGATLRAEQTPCGV